MYIVNLPGGSDDFAVDRRSFYLYAYLLTKAYGPPTNYISLREIGEECFWSNKSRGGQRSKLIKALLDLRSIGALDYTVDGTRYTFRFTRLDSLATPAKLDEYLGMDPVQSGAANIIVDNTFTIQFDSRIIADHLMTPEQFRIYIALKRLAYTNGVAWPSLALLARKTWPDSKAKAETLQQMAGRVVSSLIQEEWIAGTSQKGGSKYPPTAFRIIDVPLLRLDQEIVIEDIVTSKPKPKRRRAKRKTWAEKHPEAAARRGEIEQAFLTYLREKGLGKLPSSRYGDMRKSAGELALAGRTAEDVIRVYDHLRRRWHTPGQMRLGAIIVHFDGAMTEIMDSAAAAHFGRDGGDDLVAQSADSALLDEIDF